MGTNYYVQTKPPCPTCGHNQDADRLHIGKSSAGWNFALNTHPDLGLDSLEAWRALWLTGVKIFDEYGHEVTPADMLATITERVPGLRRHLVDDKFCIAHGDGTYDLVRGEFS